MVERAGQWPRRSGGCGGRHRAPEPELEPSWRVSLGRRRAAPVLDPDPAHLGEWTTDPRDQMGIPPRWHIAAASRCRRLTPDPRRTPAVPASPRRARDEFAGARCQAGRCDPCGPAATVVADVCVRCPATTPAAWRVRGLGRYAAMSRAASWHFLRVWSWDWDGSAVTEMATWSAPACSCLGY